MSSALVVAQRVSIRTLRPSAQPDAHRPLLRARRERQREGRTTEKREELAPPVIERQKRALTVSLRTTVTALPHFAQNCALRRASRVCAKKLPWIALIMGA